VRVVQQAATMICGRRAGRALGPMGVRQRKRSQCCSDETADMKAAIEFSSGT
jgi:hypothetical protein